CCHQAGDAGTTSEPPNCGYHWHQVSSATLTVSPSWWCHYCHVTELAVPPLPRHQGNAVPDTKLPMPPSFREELESLIQEQMKKGNNSSHIWALRQIADFMATTSPATLPTSPMGGPQSPGLASVTPINDLHGTEGPALAKGERLMRCKVGSIHRLLDLYGWAQLGHAAVTLRVSKEQEHFLVAPQGLACSEVTAASLVKVNVLGAVVEQGSTVPQGHGMSCASSLPLISPPVPCAGPFSGQPECPRGTAWAMPALCPSFPPCALSWASLRSAGVPQGCASSQPRSPPCASSGLSPAVPRCPVPSGARCPQVSALASAGGAENLIVLERGAQEQRGPQGLSAVRRAGATFGPLHKSRLGEHEFEALMRMLDNLGYRTGYTYRYPFVQEKSKPKSDVLIPATVTAFVFEEEPAGPPALRQHAHKQQKEKTRWLNTPNTYTRVSLAEEAQGSQRTKTTVEKGSSGTPIRIENPNQFVPLYTDPQEVLEMRNKVGRAGPAGGQRGLGGLGGSALSLEGIQPCPPAQIREQNRQDLCHPMSPVTAAGQCHH
uniref:Adducin 2 n=1 Tax=Serinus canaria TaxID=9135 RepID=A0A8C9NRU3_SERCA